MYELLPQSLRDAWKERDKWQRRIADAMLNDITRHIEQEIADVMQEREQAPSDEKPGLSAKVRGLRKATILIENYKRDVIHLMYPNE